MQAQTQAVPSLADAIAATLTTKKTEKKKANGYPVIDTPEMREHVDAIVAAKAEKKKAEAEIAFHSTEVADHVRTAMDNDGFAGKFSGTYTLVGNTNSLKCIFEDKWIRKADDETNLRTLLGENFDALIEKRVVVKLKAEVLENAELAAELMALVGQRFLDFFESEATLVAKPTLKEDIYRVVNKDQLELFRLYARQYNPSSKEKEDIPNEEN